MDVPEQARDLCRRFEGLRLHAYLCPAGIPTIGYGATGADIQLGMVITREWAENRLERDLVAFTRQVLQLCPILFLETPARLAAIVDFTFNLGSARLAASTLRRKINADDWDAAGAELEKWVMGGGRRLPGLILRRAAEKALLIAA